MIQNLVLMEYNAPLKYTTHKKDFTGFDTFSKIPSKNAEGIWLKVSNQILSLFSWFNQQCKNGPFFEHSPTLWGMTSVQHWQKINTGLIKMYKAEVTSFYFVWSTLVFIH